MRPTTSQFASLALVLLGLLSSGCCGPFMLHGGCLSGCGDCYVDPWINEPAECCDPCDACGNYNGQSCTSCRPVFSGAKTIWGYRYGGGACGGCDSGCDACGPTCGIEPACGIEPGCGFEPGCGMEAGCGLGGCPDCSPTSHGHPLHHSARGFVGSPTPVDDVVMHHNDPIESSRIVVPRDRRVSARPRVSYPGRR